MAERTSSSVVIAAPKAAIMRVIADFDAYPEWVEAVREAKVLENGPDGRPARVWFHLDAGVVKDRYVLGYRWEGDDAVRWSMAEQGSYLSDMRGAYLLAEGDDGTEVTYELTIEVKIPAIGMLKRRGEKLITETALGGLKRRVEG